MRGSAAQNERQNRRRACRYYALAGGYEFCTGVLAVLSSGKALHWGMRNSSAQPCCRMNAGDNAYSATMSACPIQ
jgi:hypothetical protein